MRKYAELTIVAAVGVGVILIALPALAAELFHWNGEGGNTYWTNANNWVEDDYPDQQGQWVYIDDPTEEDKVTQDADNLAISLLFLGDGHTLKLEENLDVAYDDQDPQDRPGTIEFDGIVDVKNPTTAERTLIGKHIKINSDQRTTVQYVDDGGDGTGCIRTADFGYGC
ncbi:MAG: hypothetical protein C4547_12845 [Phycisphaerales bacterium]|nr:MAG: hypothetical protein C4547_12845 [Phycisphaerales bacterium]